jgi:hypothetical protein
MSLAEITSLDMYLERFGPLLAEKTIRQLDPLHVPGRDRVVAGLDDLIRKPFVAQAHLISAATKALDRQKSTWIVAEMGTGKTYMALAAAHAHARGRPYRGLVMAPDHLLSKWAREVRATVPGATVIQVANWRDAIALVDKKREKPTGPEWYILGRDASKLDPAWEPAAVKRTRGTVKEEWVKHRRVRTTNKGEVLACPTCGQDLTDGKGNLLTLDGLSKSKKTCPARMIDDAGNLGPPCGAPLWQFVADRNPAARARRVEAATRDRDEARAEDGLDPGGGPAKVPNHPYRWAPARTIQRRLRGFFKYLIADEIHELKGKTTAQGNSVAKLGSACEKALILTGTLIGGYAWHVFHLLYRFSPRSLAEEGIGWGQEMRFSELYGRIEEVTYTREREPGSSHSHSMGRADTEKRKYVRPGIMPTLFGRHMLGNTIFLSLDEVSDALPPRPGDEIIPVEMPPLLARGYRDIEATIKSVIAPMLVMGDTSLLAKMLQALLAYPDHPFGWGESGYLKDFGITEPPDLDPGIIYPKERALIDLVKSEAAAGRQCWVYVQMTGIRDVAARLLGLLRKEGLHTEILRQSVDRRRREEWIERKGPELDVCLSHPELVETGLDLFRIDPGGKGHNFSTIVFFQTGYDLFALRQAGHRAWRIGQPLDCRCVYLYYAGTMQDRAMELMGRKLMASEALEGKFSGEGLAALAGEESAELALAKSLSEQVRSAGRAWSRVSTAARRAPIPPVPLPLSAPEVVAPTPADIAAIASLIEPRRTGKRRRAARDLPGQLLMFGDRP